MVVDHKSEVEKIFGNIPTDDYEAICHCLAVIRDHPIIGNILERSTNPNSMVAEPVCVTYAIFNALEYLSKLENSFIITSNFGSQEYDNAFKEEDGSIVYFEDLDEAIKASDDKYFGMVVNLGND